LSMIGGRGPIPPNITWGEGFYCESAQIFRHFRARGKMRWCSGSMSPVMPAARSRWGARDLHGGRFTLLNGALIMAEEHIEIGSYCLVSWNVGIADSDFHPLDPAQRMQDALALAPYYEKRPPRPPLRTAPVRIRDNVWIGMGRGDPERSGDRRELGGRGRGDCKPRACRRMWWWRATRR